MSENVKKIPGLREHNRKLASVRVVSDVLPIPEADLIELIIVDGWRCITMKTEGLVKGSKCIFIESDALVPLSDPRFAFLGELKRGRIDDFVNPLTGELDRYYKIKPIRLKGIVSEGLILSCDQSLEEGSDLTSNLGILLGSDPKIQGSTEQRIGDFPSFIPGTSLQRIQNCPELAESIFSDPNWLATEKLDGTSVTAYYGKDFEGKMGVNVCSQNMMLAELDDCLYWSTVKDSGVYDILMDCQNSDVYLAIQAEICGPKVNGNHYGLPRPTLFIYRVLISTPESRMFRAIPYSQWKDEFKSLSVPRLDDIDRSGKTVQDLLEQADTMRSTLVDRPAEGVVWEYNQDPMQPIRYGPTATKVLSRPFQW